MKKKPYKIKGNSRLRLGGKEYLPGETVYLTQKEVYQYWRCLEFEDWKEIEEMRQKIREEYLHTEKGILTQAMEERGMDPKRLKEHGILHG